LDCITRREDKNSGRITGNKISCAGDSAADQIVQAGKLADIVEVKKVRAVAGGRVDEQSLLI